MPCWGSGVLHESGYRGHVLGAGPGGDCLPAEAERRDSEESGTADQVGKGRSQGRKNVQGRRSGSVSSILRTGDQADHDGGGIPQRWPGDPVRHGCKQAADRGGRRSGGNARHLATAVACPKRSYRGATGGGKRADPRRSDPQWCHVAASLPGRNSTRLQRVQRAGSSWPCAQCVAANAGGQQPDRERRRPGSAGQCDVEVSGVARAAKNRGQSTRGRSTGAKPVQGDEPATHRLRSPG